MNVGSDGVRLQGVRLDDAEPVGVGRRIADCLQRGTRLRIATVNMGFLTLARRNPRFAEALETSDLSVLDGRLLLWCRRLAGAGGRRVVQLTGHDLAEWCVRLAARRGIGVLLLGAAPGVADIAADRLKDRFPGLRVEGLHGGEFSADGRTTHQRIIDRTVDRMRPGVVLVGLGAPKQELWLARNLPNMPPAVGIGVGGVLDTLAGRLPRAPRALQLMGLESAFQLCVRPRRFARRYLREDPATLLRASVEALQGRIRQVAHRPPRLRRPDMGRTPSRGIAPEAAAASRRGR